MFASLANAIITVNSNNYFIYNCNEKFTDFNLVGFHQFLFYLFEDF